MTPDFLTLDDVLHLQGQLIERYGGTSGLRDRGQLEAALAQPEVNFGGVFVHRTLVRMAAAYLFHLVRNHPFQDGNKRTGLLAALVFLDLNGFPIEHSSERLHDITVAVAAGKATKDEVAAVLRELVTRG